MSFIDITFNIRALSLETAPVSQLGVVISKGFLGHEV